MSEFIIPREALETAAPGLYRLTNKAAPQAGEEYDCASGVTVSGQFTGWLLARVREGSELPLGVFEAWNRGDGKAVVIQREFIP